MGNPKRGSGSFVVFLVIGLATGACGPGDGQDPPDDPGPPDACAEVVCDSPPGGYCDEDVLVAFSGGTCDADHGECEYAESRVEVDECAFGFNFGFESWVDGEPAGFVRVPASDFQVREESASVNTGNLSARLETGTSSARDLRSALPLEPVTEGERYTFHLWYQFSGEGASLQPRLDVADPVGHVGEAWRVEGTPILDAAPSWREATVTTPPLTADRSGLVPSLRVTGRGDATSWARTDDWMISVPVTRRLTDGQRDTDSSVLGFTGSQWVAAGIDNGGVLYVAANAAEPDQDHDRIVFVWTGGPGENWVGAPFGKTGRVVGPSADGGLFALKQTTGGDCVWARYDEGGGGWSAPNASDCGDRTGAPLGPGFVMEGIVDLPASLDGIDEAARLPAHLAFASTGWISGDGGTLVPDSQSPRSQDGDGDVDANETVTRHRATLLSGRVP